MLLRVMPSGVDDGGREGSSPAAWVIVGERRSSGGGAEVEEVGDNVSKGELKPEAAAEGGWSDGWCEKGWVTMCDRLLNLEPTPPGDGGTTDEAIDALVEVCLNDSPPTTSVEARLPLRMSLPPSLPSSSLSPIRPPAVFAIRLPARLSFPLTPCWET